MPPRRNVLILHQGALGDFVLTWPLALAAARLMPQRRIIYVTAASKGALARRALRVESADVEAGWHWLHAEDFDPTASVLPEPTTKLLAGAAAVYDYTGSEHLAAAVGDADVPITRLRPRPAAGVSRHHTDDLVEQLAGQPLLAGGVRAVVAMLGKRGLTPNRPGGGPVVIHPGGGSRAKCWPAGQFAELAGRLVASGKAVRVVLGEVEIERLSDLETQAFADAGAVVARPVDYLELLAAVSDASLFVGNDSGPTHLAGILGVPTVALFGPTYPAVWRPLGPAVRVVCGEAMDQIDMNEVWEALQ